MGAVFLKLTHISQPLTWTFGTRIALVRVLGCVCDGAVGHKVQSGGGRWGGRGGGVYALVLSEVRGGWETSGPKTRKSVHDSVQGSQGWVTRLCSGTTSSVGNALPSSLRELP